MRDCDDVEFQTKSLNSIRVERSSDSVTYRTVAPALTMASEQHAAERHDESL